MNLLNRDFTTVEKAILAILAFVLLGLGYYFLVDQPVREQKANALSEQAALQTDLNNVTARLNRLHTWDQELAHTEKDVDYMPPYNSGNAEVTFLNTILQDTQMKYATSFGNATRSKNQIRRTFTLQIETPGMESARNTLYRLTHGRFRCLLGNLTYREILNSEGETVVSVSTEGTFYETMIDGSPDIGLSDTSPGTLDY